MGRRNPKRKGAAVPEVEHRSIKMFDGEHRLRGRSEANDDGSVCFAIYDKYNRLRLWAILRDEEPTGVILSDDLAQERVTIIINSNGPVVTLKDPDGRDIYTLFAATSEPQPTEAKEIKA